jgi:hypothetical protein
VTLADRAEVAGNAMCGFQVARDGTLRAARGEVHHNPIGANVRVSGYDMGELLGPTMRYHSNGTNVDFSGLLTPQPGEVPKPPEDLL